MSNLNLNPLSLKEQNKLANELVEDIIHDEFNWKEKQWEQFKSLTYRWISNISLIARTIWVERNTIYKWKKKLINHHQELMTNLEVNSEFIKILEQCDLLSQSIWHEIISWDLNSKQKVDALTKVLSPLRMKAEMMWFLKWDQFIFHNSFKPVHYEYDQRVYDYYTDLIEWNLKDWKKTIAELIWTKRI